MRLVGIDNGLEGSLALLDTETNETLIEDVQLDPFREIDCEWVFHLLNDWNPDHAIIEQCFNRSDLIERGGYYVAICRLLQIPVVKIDIGTWKRNVLGKSTKDKPLSVTTCQRLFPTANLGRPTPAGTKINLDHNRAEALLLAEYLRRTLSPPTSGR